MRRYQQRHGRGRRGFTAIEISAVAAIIAILTLILVPIVRNQVAKSKIVAAQDDMFSIAKGTEISFAETGFTVRPHDLLRGPDQAASATIESPVMEWNRPLQLTQIAQLARTWDGPYVTVNRSEPLPVLVLNRGVAFRTPNGVGGGPILLRDDDEYLEPDDFGQFPQYPVDPWGNPYILFGPGALGNVGSPDIDPIYRESEFNSGMIYSLGPDGLPGNMNGQDPRHYYPDRYKDPNDPTYGGLGNGDDLSRSF
ncbi:MAG TPA: prepilin-type N-terminal cleavage/methylation domain-containing protein [Candidatus Sumerlaeota bacterium]|nr:prepilin-type N-terminal cleavage/methylation domain-containing protein [Candidatus Sumerlaeota bacterium]